MGHPMKIAFVPSENLLSIADDLILEYRKGLADVVKSIFHQVKVATEPVKDIQCHPLKAGDWVQV